MGGGCFGGQAAAFAQAQIDVGGEAAVESDFALVRVLARHVRGVVQESHVHRFLDLVGAVSGKEHNRGIGLAHLRARGR